MKSDTAVLFPASEPITVGGRALVLTPAPAFKLMHVAIPMFIDGLMVLGDDSNGGSYMLIGQQAPQLVAALTGQDLHWVEQLDAEDGQKLEEAALRVNADFFSRQLPPALDLAMVRLQKAGKSTAPAHMENSSPKTSAGVESSIA